MDLELQLEGALEPRPAPVLAPPLIDVGHQRMADARRFFFAVLALEPDEGGIRIPVDHGVALCFHRGPRLPHDLVAAHGDGGSRRGSKKRQPVEPSTP